MITKLDGPLKRELLIGDDAYTLTFSADGLTLALKVRRKGLDVHWAALVSGEAALATALNASLTANIRPPKAGTTQLKRSPRKRKTKSGAMSEPDRSTVSPAQFVSLLAFAALVTVMQA